MGFSEGVGVGLSDDVVGVSEVDGEAVGDGVGDTHVPKVSP